MRYKISVIVPVYNAERYLDECVKSLLGQTHEDIEVILVNDGSTDGSLELCRRYAKSDSRVRVLSQENRGQSATRNLGLDNMTGDFVCFCDADDIYHPQALDTLVSLIQRHDAEIAVGAMTLGKKPRWTLTLVDRVYTAQEAVTETLYQHRLNNSMCGKLFAARLFDGLRMSEGVWYEDLDFFYRLYDRTDRPVVSTDQTVYFYRDTPGSFINTFNRRRLDVLDVTAEIERHYRGTLIEPAARDRRFSANFNMFVLASRAGLADVADTCWGIITAYRRAELSDRRVRLKNKAGALASYLGRRAVLALGRLVYR